MIKEDVEMVFEEGDGHWEKETRVRKEKRGKKGITWERKGWKERRGVGKMTPKSPSTPLASWVNIISYLKMHKERREREMKK